MKNKIGPILAVVIATLLLVAFAGMFGCSSIGGGGGSAPDAGKKQIGFGVPYFAIKHRGQARDNIRKLNDLGITIYPVELMGRGNPGNTSIDKLNYGIDNIGPVIDAARDEGSWVYVWFINSNTAGNNKFTVAQLSAALDRFKKKYGTDNIYLSAVSEDDNNTRPDVRNGFRKYAEAKWPSGQSFSTRSNEVHLQGLASRKSYITDSCGAIQRFHRPCRDTNANKINANELIKLLKPRWDSGGTVVEYDFSETVNFDAARKLAEALK